MTCAPASMDKPRACCHARMQKPPPKTRKLLERTFVKQRRKKSRGRNAPALFGSSLTDLPGCFSLSLDPRLLLAYSATVNGDGIVLDRGDRTGHASPDADGEALLDGFADLLLVLNLVALGD